MIQLTVRKATYDKLQYARALLSHAVRSGDASEVLDRALDLLIGQVEKRKVGAGTRKTVQRSPNVRSRYVPAKVRRAVWERDKGRCTFVGSNGHRCNSTRFLEFDHVDPFARGGKATIEGMRLRCRAHNQFEAGRAFGVEFMNRKRREARRAAAVARNTVESSGPRQSAGMSRADRWRAVQEARGEGVEAGRGEGIEAERWEGIEAERWEGVEAEPIQFEPEHGSEKADERL